MSKTTQLHFESGVDFESEDDFRFIIHAEYNPGRDAPICSNPDAPAYSDPGDPLEIIEWTVDENECIGISPEKAVALILEKIESDDLYLEEKIIKESD